MAWAVVAAGREATLDTIVVCKIIYYEASILSARLIISIRPCLFKASYAGTYFYE